MNPATVLRGVSVWRLLAFVILSGLVTPGGAARAALTLVQDHRSPYQIVVPSESIASERHAASELQRYLERMTGVRLPVVTDAEKAGRHEIVLGNSGRLAGLGLKLGPDTLGPDGFLVRTVGRHLVIAGGRPRGTLNGVYTFLEEQLGVRWFTSDLERVPESTTVRLPALRETRVPAFEYREVFWTEMMRDADLAARHRLNGSHYRLEERHGGPGITYHPFVHSFDALIPPELFETHPEYFPLIDGQRRPGYVQRCLTHPEVLRLATEKVRSWIRDHPGATIISVSQNDTIKNCQCPDCRAADDAAGGPIGSLLRFVNRIASAIESEHPRVSVDTLAYQYTRQPPRGLMPRPNVIIRLCSIECCFAHPLDGCPSRENRRFMEDLRGWQPLARRLYVWDYTPNFAHYQQIFPNFRVLQTNVQSYVRHGVTGLFEQGNYSPGGAGEMAPLRAYLLAKLLWNPDTDLDRHLREFTDAYYGRAAGKIRDYLEVTHRPIEAPDCHAHIFDSPSRACYLTDPMLAEAERLLNEAEQRAGDDAAVRFRVQVARLPVWYAQLSTRRVEGAARTQRLQEFLTVARQAGVSHISESKALDVWAKEMGAP